MFIVKAAADDAIGICPFKLLKELVSVYDTISEAERDIAYLEAEAKKETEASK